MKIHRLVLHQQFNAPVEKVFQTFSNHEQFGKMMGQPVRRIVDSTDPQDVNGINSVRIIPLPLIPFEETIRRWEKPHRIEYQITKASPLAHHYGTMVFSSLPNGTSAIEYTIELGSPVPLWALFVKTLLRFAIGGSMKKYAKSFA